MICPKGTHKNISHECISYIKIAILVPFRDDETHTRLHQLNEFNIYMDKYLKGYEYTIFVIEQTHDGRRFNRGKLLNIGYLMASGYTHFIFHDVDLLPSKELRTYYTHPSKQPVHLASVWSRYNANSNYFGGVVSFSAEAFEKINGFPNNYWGWGGEDDELYKRTILFYTIVKPKKGTYEDLEKMSLSSKLKYLKDKDLKNPRKYELNKEHAATWKSNGLRQTTFREVGRSLYGFHCVRIEVDIQLNGDWADEYAT
jgi:hypothetical protein